jgi:hypothetical protein
MYHDYDFMMIFCIMWATLIWLASLFFELPRVDGVNPVATMDGQVYDRGYIEQWIRSCRQRRQAVTSPATGLTLVSTNLVELAFSNFWPQDRMRWGRTWGQ